jgi:hypothetical protein
VYSKLLTSQLSSILAPWAPLASTCSPAAMTVLCSIPSLLAISLSVCLPVSWTLQGNLAMISLYLIEHASLMSRLRTRRETPFVSVYNMQVPMYRRG